MQGVTDPMASWIDPPAPSRPSREFMDAKGVTWRVHEVASGESGALLFECNHTVRRVREFPAHWMSLGPASSRH